MAESITLEQGVKTKQLNLVIHHNSNAKTYSGDSHTGKCLRFEITNNTNVNQSIQIERALHIQNLNAPSQDLITINEMIVTINPKGTKSIELNALCCERNDGSPSVKDSFQLAFKHTDVVSELATILDKNKLYNNTAQQAMWALTDGSGLDNIYDTNHDTIIENKLISFLTQATKKPAPRRIANPARILRHPLEFEDKYSEEIDQPTTIGFYLTDSSGNILRIIMEDNTERRIGTVKYSYIYRGQFPVGKYFLQMKRNGVWVKVKEFLVRA